MTAGILDIWSEKYWSVKYANVPTVANMSQMKYAKNSSAAVFASVTLLLAAASHKPQPSLLQSTTAGISISPCKAQDITSAAIKTSVLLPVYGKYVIIEKHLAQRASTPS
jgi:hypothetical protein